MGNPSTSTSIGNRCFICRKNKNREDVVKVTAGFERLMIFNALVEKGNYELLPILNKVDFVYVHESCQLGGIRQVCTKGIQRKDMTFMAKIRNFITNLK
jgi:hypothetical protein